MTTGRGYNLQNLLTRVLPLFLVLRLTDLLPDIGPTMRLRGRLAAPFLGSCGRGLEIGRDVTLLGTDALHIGDDVYLAKGCWINAGGGMRIDDEVMLGPYVVVSTSSHVFRDGSARRAGWRLGPVHIGRGTWIAAHATVTRGVTVGAGNLIGANSVVAADTPDHVRVSGVPGTVQGPVREQEPDVLTGADIP